MGNYSYDRLFHWKSFSWCIISLEIILTVYYFIFNSCYKPQLPQANTNSLFLCSVCSSLSFSSKTQRSFCTQAEATMSFQGASGSQGTFILPSFPLSSPRNSPKHLSSPAASPGKCQEHPRSLSSSWPLKSFEGLPKAGSQKQLLSQKPGDSTGGDVLSVIQRDLGVVFWGFFLVGRKSTVVGERDERELGSASGMGGIY